MAAPERAGAVTLRSQAELDTGAFLRRAALLLAPGGRLLLTTDYWPEPADTAGVVVFGRAWRIFSRGEVESLITAARALGLEPDGPVDLTAADAPIHWSGRRYTFLWLAFARSA